MIADEKIVEELAKVIASAEAPEDNWPEFSHFAYEVLASDWFKDRLANARASALREAAISLHLRADAIGGVPQ